MSSIITKPIIIGGHRICLVNMDFMAMEKGKLCWICWDKSCDVGVELLHASYELLPSKYLCVLLTLAAMPLGWLISTGYNPHIYRKYYFVPQCAIYRMKFALRFVSHLEVFHNRLPDTVDHSQGKELGYCPVWNLSIKAQLNFSLDSQHACWNHRQCEPASARVIVDDSLTSKRCSYQQGCCWGE